MAETPQQDQFCSNPEHQNQLIIGFCSQQYCQQENEICNKCLIEKHQNHKNKVMIFQDIQDLSIKMKNSFEQFLQLTKQGIDELVKSFESIKINFNQQIHDCVILQELIYANQYSQVKEQVKICKKLFNMEKSNIYEPLSLYLLYQGKNSLKIKKLSFEINNLLIEIFRNKKKEDEDAEADEIQLCQSQDSEFYPEQIQLSQMIFQEAQQLIQIKNYSEAVQKLKEAYLLDNQNHEIYFERGKLLFTLKENFQALKDFDNVIRLNKKNGLAYSYKGQILNRLQKFKESIQFFFQAEKFAECQTPQLYSEIAYTYYQLNQYEIALEYCDKTLILDPNYSKAYNFKSILLMKMSKFDDAYQNIDKAINMEPYNTDYLINKGCLLHQMKQTDEALQIFEKAQELNEENPRLYRKKIQLLKSLDQEDEVLYCYQQWMKIEPQNHNAKQQAIEYLKSKGRYRNASNLEQGLEFQI